MTRDRLNPRALNRAALHRQLLLDRAPVTALDAVGRLAGLQAQAPLAPYVGLWTRLAGFRHEELKDLITERAVLRAHLRRNTVHLVDATDYLRFRPLYQPLLALLAGGDDPQDPPLTGDSPPPYPRPGRVRRPAGPALAGPRTRLARLHGQPPGGTAARGAAGAGAGR